jgi:hypothetical protein
VAKADCAVDRSPEPIAVPNAVISLDNCEVVPELDEELDEELEEEPLPLVVDGL